MVEKATIEDIQKLVTFKMEMFQESGHSDFLADNSYSLIYNTYKDLYLSGNAQHFVIKKNLEIVACAGGFIKSDIPYCFMKVPYYGFIGDVYTEPSERNQGFAMLLTKAVMNWLKEKEVKEIHLLASSQARSLYENLGFHATDEMILSI